MSALAGVWRGDGSPGAADECARMLSAQTIWGPHHSAGWDGGEVSLGRRLFRTLPEDRFDHGPTITPDGSRIVADARLDNRDDLRRDLGLTAARSVELSDAALLASAWARWGEACFERMVGDYAFAVWDERRRRLILARDPFGRRPLHFHRAGGVVAFASMPAGLHALPRIVPEPDEAAMAAFLALAPEAGQAAFFKGLQRVPPGDLVIHDAFGATARRHYTPPRRRLVLAGPDDYAEALRERLDAAVGACLRGVEGRVGAHLSSGWDSAAVAATAARLLAAENGRVAAFTAAPREGYAGGAPEGRHADESEGAARLAVRYANIDHHVVRGTGRSPLADLDRDIALCGRPILNPCNQAWFNDINRAARDRGVRVMLTGDFGNLGLTDDGLDGLPELLARGRLREWLALAGGLMCQGGLRWRGVLAASVGGERSGPVWRLLRRLNGEWIGEPGGYSALRRELWSAHGVSIGAGRGDRAARRLFALTRMDLSLYAKGALAAWGVDVRDPLTDRRLIEFCLSVPVEQMLLGGRPRALARRALADRVPAELLDAPTRGYQGADWHEGLSADRATVLGDLDRLASSPAAARLIDVDRLRRLAAGWPGGDWTRASVLEPYRLTLLRGLSAGRFLTHTARANG